MKPALSIRPIVLVLRDDSCPSAITRPLPYWRASANNGGNLPPASAETIGLHSADNAKTGLGDPGEAVSALNPATSGEKRSFVRIADTGTLIDKSISYGWGIASVSGRLLALRKSSHASSMRFRRLNTIERHSRARRDIGRWFVWVASSTALAKASQASSNRLVWTSRIPSSHQSSAFCGCEARARLAASRASNSPESSVVIAIR